MKTDRTSALICSFVWLMPLTAAAQDPPAIGALQAKEVLSDEERTALCTWINQRVTTAATGQGGEVAQAVRELRDAYTGTQGYKQAYIGCAVSSVSTAFKKAESVPAAMLLTTLIPLETADTHKAFIDALRDDRVGVRQVGATGLRKLRSRLASAGGTAYADALAALTAAAKNETAVVPLETMYQALDYTSVSGADATAALTALLDVLEARGSQYASGQVKAEAADVDGLKIAARMRASMSPDQQKRYTAALGWMLRHAINRYTRGDHPLHTVRDKHSGRQLVALRDRTELLIEIGEAELLALLAPPDRPQVAEKMKTGGKDAPTGMGIEWKKWVPMLNQAVGQDFELPTGDEGG